MTVFGPLVAPINVEKAVLATLEEWFGEYAAEIERYNGLPNKAIGRPEVPEAYRGALDWSSLKADWLPAIRVICNPAGEPEWLSEVYLQSFQVDVGWVVKSEEGTDPEGTARRNASLGAAAVMGAIVDHESLGRQAALETAVTLETSPTLETSAGFLLGIQKIDLTGSPKVEFLEPENRRYAIGVTTFLVHMQILEPKLGPQVKQATPEEPYPEAPAIKTEMITITAESPSEEIH